jgi:phosphoribosylglycinamide formyltransferase 1
MTDEGEGQVNLVLGFLASHEGSNMQAIVDACRAGDLNAVPAVVISNNADARALVRAEREGISHYHLSSATHPSAEDLDRAILDALSRRGVTIVILAGYMKKIGPRVLERFRSRILNIHPALLPKYGGKGMYGRNVHEAVLKAGEKETGVTVHLVDGEYDTGRIVSQCRVPVLPGDTVDTLAGRVLETEHRFFVETLRKIGKGEIRL